MKSTGRNLGASVRQRLLNLAKERGEDFNFVLRRYGLERLLYRLGTSRHAGAFVLKGAMLFPLWSGSPHRSTHDMDLLGNGPPELERLVSIFRELASIPAEDGIVFFPDTVEAEAIREDAIYDGIRLTLEAHLDAARIPLQVDVGFGDSVTPGPVETDYPTLLALPPPHVRVYRREVVIAEKLQAMVERGLSTSRMKDFYDIWFLASNFEFDGATLAGAIAATFARRQTPIPEVPPIGITAVFADDAAKQTQWRAFLTRSRPTDQPPALPQLIEVLNRFLWPVIQAAAGKGTIPLWKPGEGWTDVR